MNIPVIYRLTRQHNNALYSNTQEYRHMQKSLYMYTDAHIHSYMCMYMHGYINIFGLEQNGRHIADENF